MQMQNNSENKIDQYLDHLEFLSSRIADNISMGLFKDINKNKELKSSNFCAFKW